jgi:peptide-methionine (S)-S-oxide reductase
MSQDKVFGGAPIVTEVQPLAAYWPAEAYHQDFFERNPHQGYCLAVAAPKVAKLRKTFAALVRA